MLDVAKIKRLREKAGLTQQQAADLAGFKSRQYWYLIESGENKNIEMDTLDRIAKALGVKAKQLLK